MLAPKSLRYPPSLAFGAAALFIILIAAVIALTVWINPLPLLDFMVASTPTVAPTNTPTPVPQPSTAPITAANVKSLDISRLLGRGYFSGGFAWSGNQLAVTSPIGVSIFNTDDLTVAPRLIAFQANTLGFSADGKTLLTATMITGGSVVQAEVARWDVATLRQISTYRFDLGDDGGWFANFVADSTLLPYLWVGKLRFLNILTNQTEFELSSATPLRPTNVTLSPDGKYVAAGTVDNKLHIWEVAKPDREKYVLSDAKEQIYSLTFTPDSQHLITVDNRIGTLRQWDMATGKQIQIGSADGSVFDIQFTPDGKQYVTANEDGTISIYNADTNIPIIKLIGHQRVISEGRSVASLSFNADGSQLASVGDNGTIKLWDMRGGQEIANLDSQSVCPDQLGYSSDGRRLIAMCEDSAQVWDIAAAKVIFTARADISDINSARLSADGKYIAFTENRGILQLWDVDANKRTLIHEIQRQPSSTVTNGGGTFTSRLSFSHDGKWLAFAHSFDSAVLLYNIASGDEQVLTGHTQGINGLQFSPDDRTLLSFSADGSAHLWNVPTATLRAVTDNAAQPIIAAQFSPDGSVLAVTYADSTLELLDANTLAAQAALHSPAESDTEQYYGSLAFNADGSVLVSFSVPLASPSTTSTIQVWDVRAKHLLTELSLPLAYPRSMALSPDGTQLVFSAGGALLFYQIAP